jgi:hypothetical protein
VLLATGALALGALTGCTTSSQRGASDPSATPDPDAQIRAAVAATQTALAARYRATVHAFPSQARALTVGDRHVSYAAAVTATAAPSASALPTGAQTTLPVPAASVTIPPVPATAAAAVDALRAAERAAAGTSLEQCLVTVDPELTRIVALIGAGCAAAAAVLDGYRRG